MLEVVFSDSAKGAMTVAKNVETVDGGTAEVVYVGFCPDVGDISVQDEDSAARRKVFRELWASVAFAEEETEGFFRDRREDREKLLRTARNGGEIRVWRSQAPFSACGFAYVCDLLKPYDCRLSEITLPEYTSTAENVVRTDSDWGEIPPGELYRYLPLEKEVSSAEKARQSALWKELMKENAPLRAVVNGRLISVPENFYDHLIMNHLSPEEFLMARLIGEILGKYPLGVSDGWYALRIRKLIAEGKLAVVRKQDASHPYGLILKKIL